MLSVLRAAAPVRWIKLKGDHTIMTANDIRNIALLGHGGSGKTSLAEQMLFMTKGTDRLGRTADGNTTCDYDAEEIKRQISISLAFAPVNYKGVKINVMDAPGNFDFSGEALSAIRAAECAVLVGAAKDGLSVGMERSWKMLGKKPRMIFINRTDEDNSDYASCLDALKGKFGQAIAPIVAPVIDGNKKVTAIVDLLHNTAYEVKGGKAAACAIPADMADEVEALRAELMEPAAGADEELMEKFFDTMELSAQDMAKGLKIGVRDGSVCPVLCGSANTGLGVEMLLQTILDLAPVATDMPAEAAQDDDGNDIQVAFDPNGPTAAIVFKTISDQYGKYSMIKVIRGKVTGDMALYYPTTGYTEKLGRLYVMKGKKGEETKEICCGDIGAIGKMDKVKTGDTLCDAKNIVRLHGMDYAQPCYSRAISPKTKQEIEKLGTGLNKLNEEDPTFHVVNNAETHQTLILNGLRTRVRIESDSKLLSGRDVAISCMLGAEEFGFGTSLLMCEGCVMMRVCNLDTCPVGVATQNPELRKRFRGKPEYVENFMRFIAQELREYMARLGVTTIDEMVGRTDLLTVSDSVQEPHKGKLEIRTIQNNKKAGKGKVTNAQKSLNKIKLKNRLNIFTKLFSN